MSAVWKVYGSDSRTKNMQPVILVADDESDSADLLGMLLEIHFPDATVCVAHGGQLALDQAHLQAPQVAVLDLEMPGLDGESLALALRASFSSDPPFLVALSGNVGRLAAISHNGAFDHHMSKPANVDGLVRLLKKVLDSRR